MSKTAIRIELNEDGIRSLLKDPAISEVCREYCCGIAARAGEGYVAEERTYPERNGCAVYPSTQEANKDNLKNNTLLKVRGW